MAYVVRMSVPPVAVMFTGEDLAIIDQMADHILDALNDHRHHARPPVLSDGLLEFRTAIERVRHRARAQLDATLDVRA